MGRSRSRDRRRDEEKKDKDRKRSRSREKKDKSKKEKRSRSREKKEKKEKKEKEPEREPEKEPEMQYRRWRFDSPPKEEEYQRDAMLTGNPMGLGGVAAALQGGLSLAGISNTINPLQIAADTKASRELYIGNLPAGITGQQLVQFLNQVAQAVKVNTLPGEPVVSATMGGSGANFAFIEFRTAEEAANGLRLNGVELLGCQLKVGRPKGYVEGGSQPQLAIGGPGAAPSLGDLMAQHGALRAGGNLALPGLPGQQQQAGVDNRLCLCQIPKFVTEERIKELLITFGQIKFYAMQKDEEGKSVGVAFFEYQDMMTQQQARAALDGLELGSNKLRVLKPDQVIELGLVARDQKLGARVIPSKVLYLKNVVTAEDMADEVGYQEVCTDIRLEAEKFGAVTSIEVPRGSGSGGASTNLAPSNALMDQAGGGGPLALANAPAEDGAQAKAAPKAPAALPAPTLPDLSMALVPVGGQLAKVGAPMGGPGAPGASGPMDPNAPGFGYAFIEFGNIEGASKAKKALNGRRFGPNLVEAEYFSEDKYYAKDFYKPTPNTDEPKRDPGAMELALVEGGLDEAPALVD
eukprot:TRINITY_DN5548_c0_g1_i1.p1 TRINITY_DN5548_c0_g1~~TRINITY_DN5548_c0_g1_i1.p1  ORF type:complete len:578 (-),score=176.65 TRINITY_DN5548_c0_g1_i1:294-2027(-)